MPEWEDHAQRYGPTTKNNTERAVHGQMHVRFRAANLVNEHLRRVDDAFAEQAVGERLDCGAQQRQAVLGVPDEVQVDFAVVVA